MNQYQAQNIQKFFTFVSRRGFHQDYMAFQEAIEQDFNTYHILGFQYWVDKITSDGTKRYLYVRWDKRYTIINNTKEHRQTGTTRLLFETIKGKYKLIGLSGDILWGESLPGWQ
ncbi:hypothetical protein [Sulfurospirillum sp. 1612]|uniref:hypothetical protein n=1 Tax=Sulfurospirillum sp. 1612 TaxID=3094835 RepID=UPI002F94AD9E